MNPTIIKKNLLEHIGQRVKIQVFGMRNRYESFVGVLTNVYPAIFVIKIGNTSKSFSYNDVITGEVNITFI